jgi:murein L,D-transpeptidase YcbB/YkuD
MRVIVGDPEHQTPLFSDKMTYVVFSPYWNIPPTSCARKRCPASRAIRTSCAATTSRWSPRAGGDEIDPASIDWSDESATKSLRFRQRPGDDNALGLVKFVFPNHFNVYLHDTPNDRLFFKERRCLSHGCIRVEDPIAMAKYVMGDQPEWTEPRIRAAMSAGTKRRPA